jgi:hypothetical protein
MTAHGSSKLAGRERQAGSRLPIGSPAADAMCYPRCVDSDRGPDWLREAVVAVRDESVRFLVTVLQCTRHPRRFAAAWFAGETPALNPIGYVSTALAISTAVRSVTLALLPLSDDGDGFWSNVGAATLPYAYYALLGVLCHVVLRQRKTARPLRASMGIALYVGGGPGLLLSLTWYLDVWLYFALTRMTPGRNGFTGAPGWAQAILGGLVLGASAHFLMTLAGAFRGLHAVSRVRAIVAIVVALAASAVLLGVLRAVVDFTLGVPYFRLDRGGLTISF